MSIRNWTSQTILGLWIVWLVVIAIVLWFTLLPVVPDTQSLSSVHVYTPVGSAGGVIGVVLAAAVTLIPMIAPLLALTMYWAWRRSG